MASRKTAPSTPAQYVSPSAYGAEYTDKAVAEAEKAQQTTPFLGAEGKQIAQTTGGAAQLTGGIFSGNKADIKQGASNLGKGVWSALTAAPLRSLNEPPPPSFLGGSAEALQQRRDMYQSGIGTGQNIQMAGLNVAGQGAATLDRAGMQAQQDRANAYGMTGIGYGIGSQGLGSQNAALDASIANAGRDVGSAAAQQMRMANDVNAQQMMGMASAARGGNQAAAMRNAQAQGSQNALATNQQLGLMRLQEAANQRDAVTQAQQAAAGMYGNQAQLGYGMAGQGISQAQQSTGQLATTGAQTGQIGLGMSGIGTTSQGQYINALTETDKAQLDADKAQAEAAQKSKGGVAGVVGKVIGSIF